MKKEKRRKKEKRKKRGKKKGHFVIDRKEFFDIL